MDNQISARLRNLKREITSQILPFLRDPDFLTSENGTLKLGKYGEAEGIEKHDLETFCLTLLKRFEMLEIYGVPPESLTKSLNKVSAALVLDVVKKGREIVAGLSLEETPKAYELASSAKLDDVLYRLFTLANLTVKQSNNS